MGNVKLLHGKTEVARSPIDGLPKCAFCQSDACYDMRMNNGAGGMTSAWAFMCAECEESYGIHILGTGFGQKLFIKGDESSIGTKR